MVTVGGKGLLVTLRSPTFQVLTAWSATSAMLASLQTQLVGSLRVSAGSSIRPGMGNVQQALAGSKTTTNAGFLLQAVNTTPSCSNAP
jgi:hypothetical protein